MNNKPVAWMHTTIPSWVSTFIHPETEPEEWIALYTHPADLTDEEILVLAETYKNGWVENNFERQLFMDAEALVLFARAILRKAQE